MCFTRALRIASASGVESATQVLLECCDQHTTLLTGGQPAEKRPCRQNQVPFCSATSNPSSQTHTQTPTIQKDESRAILRSIAQLGFSAEVAWLHFGPLGGAGRLRRRGSGASRVANGETWPSLQYIMSI